MELGWEPEPGDSRGALIHAGLWQVHSPEERETKRPAVIIQGCGGNNRLFFLKKKINVVNPEETESDGPPGGL